ncbi:jg23285 [Pararge aegeria aegeria]|uniref:Jg23285 protein n=1 Tax=Pararge aegeria aegeria TaxID=348720 RepID=A0A8S4SRM6_9NEOP|nr:jg23285 [Pararge aegeria aegeria]
MLCSSLKVVVAGAGGDFTPTPQETLQFRSNTIYYVYQPVRPGIKNKCNMQQIILAVTGQADVKRQGIL